MKRYHRPLGGAELTADGVRFDLWAPAADAVTVVLEGGPDLPMSPGDAGWFTLATDQAGAGSRYRYRIGDGLYPDPYARYQPDGPHGPSQIVDPAAHDWREPFWTGRPWHEQVLYELHVGTFSPDGTFDGVVGKLDHLVELGITAIELMPVAECPGRWNWGYDGVQSYAVEERYGGPDGLKRLVEACHDRGVSVILDVVYNHFGPEANFLHAYAPDFFTERHHTPWGAGLNFDGVESRAVREYFIQNALYWLTEYHLDGLRLDAVHAIADDSDPDIVVELGRRVREAIIDRPIHLILENDRNQAGLLGSRPYDAQWNDDLHHALHVLLTGSEGGYYVDYADSPIDHLGRALSEGFAYQGETSLLRKGERRGEPSGALPPTAFVSFIQNHDQVGNHAYGWRLGKFAEQVAIQAAATILLLAPQVPMLWQGEEWNADQPFPFFCDFTGELAEAVRQGRAREFAAFPEFSSPEARARIPDPIAESTFQSAVLDWQALERPTHAAFLSLYKELIAIRRAEIMPRIGGIGAHAGRYRRLAERALEVTWQLPEGTHLRLIANLSPTSVAYETIPREGRIYTTGPSADGELPPWFVSVDLVTG